MSGEHGPGDHPYVDREDLQGIYRDWRRIAESYGPDRVLIGEIWLPDAERFARYLRPGVLHSAFNFDFMASPWDAAALRASIEQTLTSTNGWERRRPGCCPTTTSPGR